MRRLLAGFIVLALVAACSTTVAEFWRPISEPNLLLPLEKAQSKLKFDLSQCRCGIFPDNITQGDYVEYQPDKQRLAATGIIRTTTDDADDGSCVVRPSLVVAECMRGRGWEITRCSGRMPLAGGGAVCAGYAPDSEP